MKTKKSVNPTKKGNQQKKDWSELQLFVNGDVFDRVIFRDNATIVFWKSGKKTVVKCGKNDTFDKEKGLAMALFKRALRNKSNYNNVIRDVLANAEDFTSHSA